MFFILAPATLLLMPAAIAGRDLLRGI